MGRRGPAKEPSSLTLIKGNPGKRPINKKEPKPKPTAPKCPSWLNSDAKKMWRNLAPELEKLGLFTIVDGEAFAAACQSYGVWVQTEKVLMEKGRVMKIGRYDKEGNEISLKDIIGEDSEKKQPDAVEDYMFYEQIKCIYGNIEKVLAPREIEILKYRYGLFGAKECTQNELADRLGISRSYVSRIEKKALGKLREVLIERKLI